MRKNKLKVYGGIIFVKGKQMRAVVATTSQKRLSEIVKESLYEIRNFWSETGNDAELEIALSKPESVFYKTLDYFQAEEIDWTELVRG